MNARFSLPFSKKKHVNGIEQASWTFHSKTAPPAPITPPLDLVPFHHIDSDQN
jgi:hypothetical protein